MSVKNSKLACHLRFASPKDISRSAANLQSDCLFLHKMATEFLRDGGVVVVVAYLYTSVARMGRKCEITSFRLPPPTISRSISYVIAEKGEFPYFELFMGEIACFLEVVHSVQPQFLSEKSDAFGEFHLRCCCCCEKLSWLMMELDEI